MERLINIDVTIESTAEGVRSEHSQSQRWENASKQSLPQAD
jgi:hypothetical protein